MTRIRKKRSLKRVHNVKTGSVSKIKKAQAFYGQSEPKRKQSKPHKQLSAYEKYLLENPEAKQTGKPTAKGKKLKKNDNTETTTKNISNKGVTAKNKTDKAVKTEKTDKKKSLFEQFDETNLNDIY